MTVRGAYPLGKAGKLGKGLKVTLVRNGTSGPLTLNGSESLALRSTSVLFKVNIVPKSKERADIIRKA